MSNGRYILDESGETPVRCDDLMEWAHWFEGSPFRRVAITALDGGRVVVSTVFLALDHAFGGEVPVLWETMVFDPESRECARCAGNREQALAMHAAMVERVEAVLALNEGVPLEA